MKKKLGNLRDQKGVAIVIVAGLTVMFVAFVALSVDIAHLYVVRNELQNAADAGALAGARRLYFPGGTAINPTANQVSYEAAIMNSSEKVAVEVNSPNTNADDVQRGHWSFATQTFTPSDNTAAPDLWNVTSAELDADLTYVNAVRVRTRRQSTQATSFFARILGHAGFNASAEAVAYVGFSGSVLPGEVGDVIAVCKQSLIYDGKYQCNIGRMLNSGSKIATHNTAGWTNFTQQPCETAAASSLRPLICSEGNTEELMLGIGVGASGGVVDNVLRDLRDCFDPVNRTTPWNITVLVIDCPGNNVSNCPTLLGAVNVDIVWISRDDADTEKKFEAEDFPPAQMGDWFPDPNLTRAENWEYFVDHFNLQNVDDLRATYAKKSVYFKPNCSPHILTGRTGGQNYGIIAKIPVLVN